MQFISYLGQRAKVARINRDDFVSEHARMSAPQGTNLGLLLFLIYVNYLNNPLIKKCDLGRTNFYLALSSVHGRSGVKFSIGTLLHVVVGAHKT